MFLFYGIDAPPPVVERYVATSFLGCLLA